MSHCSRFFQSSYEIRKAWRRPGDINARGTPKRWILTFFRRKLLLTRRITLCLDSRPSSLNARASSPVVVEHVVAALIPASGCFISIALHRVVWCKSALRAHVIIISAGGQNCSAVFSLRRRKINILSFFLSFFC